MFGSRITRWARGTKLHRMMRRAIDSPARAAYDPTMSHAAAPKLGFLHLPKTGGSSLTDSLYSAFGLEQVHFAVLVPKHHTAPLRNPGHTIQEGTLSHVLARNMPFLSGHCTYTTLKSLKREFVFTVLRDPRERAISVFTYTLKRARSEQTLRRHPEMGQFAGMGFMEYMEKRQPYNNIAKFLLGDMPEWDAIKHPSNRGRPAADFTDLIDTSLKRLDVVYACSNQEVLDDLKARGVSPSAAEVTKNVSEGAFEFGDVASRQEFLDILDQMTWLDRLIYERAAILFPDTVRRQMLSDDQLIANLQKRFGLKIGQ